MEGRMQAFRSLFTPAIAGILVIYALYRLLTHSSYMTSFGLTADPLGYVSNLPFMAGAAVGNIISCSVVFVLYLRGILRPWALDCRGVLAVTALTYLAVALAPDLFVRGWLSPALLGLIWGFTLTPLGFAAAELLVCGNSALVLIVQLAFASFLLAVFSLLMNMMPPQVSSLICAGLSVAFIFLLSRARTTLVPLQKQAEGADVEAGILSSAQADWSGYPDIYEQQRAGKKPLPLSAQVALFRETLRNCSTPLMAAAFFELVAGLVNIYAFFTPGSFSISANAPLEGSFICSLLVIGFVIVAARTPYRKIVYLGVFPAIIAVFLALPFFSENFGVPLSAVIYSAYVFTAMISTFCILQACRKTGDCVYGITAFASAVMRIFLVIGLVLGWYFGTLPNGGTFMSVSIMCVVCVYLLGIVVVWWALKNAREKRVVEVVEVVVDGPAQSFEDHIASRVDELVELYSLSPRERDVLIGLAQGHTAASIAEHLYISTSTAQGYIKSLYVKLGVNKKQQVIDLFSK